MKFNLNLKAKMLLNILVLSSIIYAIALGYVSYRMNTIAFSQAKELTKTYSRAYANQVKADLNNEMSMSRALAHTLEEYAAFPEEKRKEITVAILENVAARNPDIMATWLSLELSFIDSLWEQPYGRERITFYNVNQQLEFMDVLVDTAQGFQPSGAYYDALASQKELITPPYFYTYQAGQEQLLEASVGVPLLVDGESVGLVGFDMVLEHFQNLIADIHPFEESYAFLVANDGQIVAHPNEELLGTLINEVETSKGQLISQRIAEGKELTFSKKDVLNATGKEYYYAYSPIYIGEATTPWSFGFAVPISVMMKEAKDSLQKSIFVGFIGLLLIALVIWYMANKISSPIKSTTKVLHRLAHGRIDTSHKLDYKGKDETGQMAASVNKLIEGLNRTVQFAREIGKGNLDASFEKLSENDALGDALVDMQKSLVDARKQEHERQEIEKKQNWATTGIAKFSDILRQNNDDLSEFAYHILSNLVQYIEANQGGLFILNDEDPQDKYIELMASYAYERRKYLEKRIELGEGLIGRSVQEQKTIYMTELPENYIAVTSGLGDAPPNALLIVPLKVNEEIHGILELATFNQFEPHVIKFVETVAESIASTLSTTKINIRTTQLLEKSQQQSEEMAAQEEEMRQNMEELQATQEEAARKSAEMESLLSALNQANLVIEYDMDGYILSVNDNYLKVTGMSRDELIGTHHSANMQFSEEEKEAHKQFWLDLQNGQSKKTTSTVVFKNKEYRFVETYTPILDENGNPEKILKIATDITNV
ncbi:MAG: GAF domain-containing protein [Bacteroidota bacterium]